MSDEAPVQSTVPDDQGQAPSPATPRDPTEHPAYPQAVIDLLGALGYGELAAFSRLAADAEMAPSLALTARLSRVAVGEFEHYEAIVAELVRRGADPDQAMEPFVKALDAFHERTRPSTWLEGVVKAYIGDGIAADFYREISQFLDPTTRDLVVASLDDAGRADFAVSVVREAIRADPRVAGRLALYGRRLVGEALTQGQQVAVERDALASLLVGGMGGRADLAEIGRMFTRLTDNHTARMGRLGLAA
ncbi:MAG: ferritin-like fold-containing protein [Nostocoides sp.]